MNRRTLARFVMLCVFLLLPQVIWAQATNSGTIAGSVKDTTGAVLPGVTVEAASPALIEKARIVITDAQGNYKILDLRPGIYIVTFTLPGFSTVRREGLELTTGFTATANAELKIGSLAETVTVSGASPMVDIQNVRTQNVFSREALDTLPTGKTIQAFAALLVGASVTSVSGNMQDVGGNKGEQYGTVLIHGSHDYDGKVNYDGMRFNNMVGGGGGSARQYFVNQAGVQEVTIETSGMSAESETGGTNINFVPKDGGNIYKFYINTSGTGDGMQRSNLTDALRARGLTAANAVKKIYDFGVGVGGPIVRDKLWFYTAHRWWGSQEYAPGNFHNKTQGTPFYTPDFDRPGYTNFYQRDHSLRLTWQASSKHRFTFSDSNQANCNCHLYVDNGLRAPEAAINFTYWPIYLAQSTWTYPATSRLLFQAGAAYLHNMTAPHSVEGVSETDISVTELSRNYMYNSFAGGLTSIGERHEYTQHNERLSMSYVTGSHAFKVGVFTQSGVFNYGLVMVNQALSYSFNNGVPSQVTQWASPGHTENTLKLNLGIYGQDQWTIKNLTLNLGVRYDSVNAYVPAQHRPAGRFVPAFDIARIENVPDFKDISARLGAAYDLFGNGKTAIKGSWGRYVAGVGAGFANMVNPASALVVSAGRTWNDANQNYIPDCDLQHQAANGECAALNNNRFGTTTLNTRYAQDVLTGFGNRGYDWQGSLSVQQELRPGMAVNVGYFRTWFGNFTTTDNLLVTPTDYDQYCVMAPTDARLPGGGGYQVCGLYDIQKAKFGQVDNLVTQASHFGKRTEIYDGVDATINARFGRGGLLQGGLNVGRTAFDNCAVVDSPQLQFCHNTPPFFRPQFKFAGVYPLPWDLQASATFQSLPGVPYTASYAVSNAQVAPSLGRNLSACAAATGPCSATATIELIEPNTVFEKRLNQLDLRFTKIVRIGRARVQGMFDIYNIFNDSSILNLSSRYGPNWLQPSSVIGARLFKFGAQLDF